MEKTTKIEEISTKDLIRCIGDKDCKIIDVRSVNAYNGWHEKGEARGGHIKRAKSLPAKWTRYAGWLEIVRSKDILPENSLILYGYDDGETEGVAQNFLTAGYTKIRVYNGFLDEYCPDPRYPLNKLPRHNRLVSAHWLNELIKTGKAPEYDNSRYVICHAHYQNPEDYNKGHIPGAVEIDTNTIEAEDTWNRRSPNELKKVFEDLGITSDTTAILYGRFSSPTYDNPFPGSRAGHLGAMRCAFIMMYAGVKDVRILNGGVHAWLDEGLKLTKEKTKKEPVKDFGAKIPAHPEYAVDLEEAKEILKDPKRNLVSVRSWREYNGEVSGYHFIKKKGRIPGAVLADSGSDSYHLENYRNLDHTTREYHEIEDQLKKLGVTPDKHNAFYCGTGWRASEAFFNVWLMGWDNISVFDGGWFEWSNNNLPYEQGVPKEQSENHAK